MADGAQKRETIKDESGTYRDFSKRRAQRRLADFADPVGRQHRRIEAAKTERVRRGSIGGSMKPLILAALPIPCGFQSNGGSRG